MNPPLAEIMRPRSLEDIEGQDHLIGDNGFITNLIKNKTPLSFILWGPPGSGKTSIARLYAKSFSLSFQTISAVFSGVADLKKIFKDAENSPLLHRGTVLFVDEIHRFNKAQQDAFLPFIEDGTIILVGATAENPSFYLNHALLSRLRVLRLNPLNHEALAKLLTRYEEKFGKLKITPEGIEFLIFSSQGDGRYFLNLIENIKGIKSDALLDIPDLQKVLQRRAPLYDREGDQHYNLISALHKSIRGSDPNASLYWFSRMVEGGEDPLFLARRLIRVASEDVGLADPQALPIAIAARDAYQMLGSPEGELALAQLVVYLALAPKSNALYTAFGEAQKLASETGHLSPPSIILNAPTQTMKELGYGKGYIYDHDAPQGFSGQNYFPPEIPPANFYQPVERGFEREMKKRMDYFANLRKKREDQ